MQSYKLKYKFNLEKTLKSGQSFRWEQNENIFHITDNNKEINIYQEDDILYFDVSKKEFNNFWINYLDLSTNYDNIELYIVNNYPELRKVLEISSGIHVLNQNFLETYIALIISQQNNIKRIEKSIEKLCQLYSTNNKFPDIDSLKKLTVDDFNKLGVGYRDKYLIDAVKKYDLISNDLTYENLLSVNGIGDKVASCIMLFSSNNKEMFPIDTHIKHILEKLYFNGEDVQVKTLQKFVNEKFPKYKGYIQQYLFYYCLVLKI